MIGIQRIDTGAFLDVGLNSSLDIRLINPASQDELGDNTHSLSFNLPSTPRNRAELGFGERPQVRNPDTGFDVAIWFDGWPLLYGELSTRERSLIGAGIAAQWAGGVSPLASSFGAKLRDIDLGGTRIVAGGAPATSQAALITHANNLMASPLTADYLFVPVRNAQWYDGTQPDWGGYVNHYDAQAGTFLANADANGERWRNSLVPFPRVRYLLQQAFAHLGLLDLTDYSALPGLELLALWNNQSLDATSPVNAWNYGTDRIDLTNHVPDWSIADLLRYLRRLMNLGVYVDPIERTVALAPRQAVRTAEMQDWRSRCLRAGTITRRAPSESGRVFRWVEDGEDAFFGTAAQLAEKQVLNGSTEVLVAGAPLQQAPLQPYPLLSGAVWSVPFISQVGRTVLDDVAGSEANPRTVVWRGFQAITDPVTGQPSATALYPLGSAITRGAANQVVGDYTFLWPSSVNYGTRSLYEQWWETYLDDGEESIVEVPVMLTLADLLSLDFRRPALLQNEDGPYLVEVMEVAFNLTTQGMTPATLTAKLI